MVAAAHVKADFSAATFKDFYRADYGYENGIYVEGLQGTRKGRKKIGDWWDAASVEFEKERKGKHRGRIHVDVDLYHPNNAPFAVLGLGGLANHLWEVDFNKRYKRGTHPGDVIERLKDKAKINTGVSCKNN